MSSDYSHADETDKQQAKRIIVRLLTHDGRGRDNAIASSVIASSTPVSDTTVRDYIPEIRREYRLPIASCTNGYFIIEDADELERQIRTKEQQIRTTQQHKQDLLQAWDVDPDQETIHDY